MSPEEEVLILRQRIQDALGIFDVDHYWDGPEGEDERLTVEGSDRIYSILNNEPPF